MAGFLAGAGFGLSSVFGSSLAVQTASTSAVSTSISSVSVVV
ncbi:hypothetical protein [Bacillus sp. 28A-2]|nr:hypothetical protein [Bacillus sp. 28A-2]